MSIRMSPNQREVLSAISTITGKQEYLTSTGGILNSGATLTGSAIPASGLSTAAAVQIVDGSGNQITSFGGGTQYIDGGTVPTHPTAPTLVYDNGGTWQHVSVANPLPVTAAVTITGVATSANQTNATQKTQIVDGSGNVIASTSNSLNVQVANFPATQPVSLTSTTITGTVAVTGTFFQTTQPVSGTITGNQGTAASLTAGWPTINGELADVTGTFTNATQTTSVTASGLDGYGNTLISINGTYGTATAIFEGSDDGGTTWYAVQAARDSSNVIELGYTGLSSTSQTWQINNPGFDSLRVRSTAVASGTVNVRLSSSAAPVASGTIVGLGTSIPAGSNAIGSITNTSFVATQATASSLNATVVGTGTFAVQATQSGTWNIGTLTGITNALPAGTNAIGTVGTTSAVVNVGQQTVSTTAVQLSASSTIPTNGIIVQALSTNAASIFVGGSGVTTSTGFELVAGQAMSFSCNLNTLYIRSVASTTDKVCFNVL